LILLTSTKLMQKGWKLSDLLNNYRVF